MTLFISFYSFKGGVGRTSAMMNVARHLAERKKKVLVVDADVAAPGIDVFEILDRSMVDFPSYSPYRREIYHQLNELAQGTDNANDQHIWKTGVLEKLDEKSENEELTNRELIQKILGIADENSKPANHSESSQPVNWMEVDKFVEANSKPAKLLALKEENTGFVEYLNTLSGGNDPDLSCIKNIAAKTVMHADIKMMRAGAYEDNKEYEKIQNELITRLNELAEDRDDDSGISKNLIKLAREFHQEVNDKIKADYVLIDCRPGRDIITQFCVNYLAEINVLMFNLNPWNFSGIQTTYSELVKFHKEIKKDPKKYSGAHPEIRILLAASPVPRYAKNSDLYAGQIQNVNNTMSYAKNIQGKGGSVVEVPFSDILLLRDIIIFDYDQSDLANTAYSELADLIIAENTGDVQNIVQRVLSGHQNKQEQIEQLKVLASLNLNSPIVALELAKLQMDGADYNDSIDSLCIAGERENIKIGELTDSRSADDESEIWNSGFTAEIRINLAEVFHKKSEEGDKPEPEDSELKPKTLELKTTCDIICLHKKIISDRKGSGEFAKTDGEYPDFDTVFTFDPSCGDKSVEEFSDRVAKRWSDDVFRKKLDDTATQETGDEVLETDNLKKGETELMHALALMFHLKACRLQQTIAPSGKKIYDSDSGSQSNDNFERLGCYAIAAENMSQMAFDLDKQNAKFAKSLAKMSRTRSSAESLITFRKKD